ncbi:MAG: helix-turn-helix transcriptional regulator [Alphaproteobacteria bacterium]|nr:helix-turn-helix transcriptional regulator [Alphaproteobacteria bacterium]
MEIKQAIEALGALAQETRLEVFRLLVTAGPEGLPAGEIAESLGAPASTLSFHLAYLSRAGLVVSRRESRSIIYSANFDGMRGLLDFLTQDCCKGRPEMCSPLVEPKPAAAARRAKTC